MFEYIKDESDFLKTYINELRNMEQNDFSAIFLDSLEERIRKNKQCLAGIKVAYEEIKIDSGITNDLDELEEVTVQHSSTILFILIISHMHTYAIYVQNHCG